MDRQEILGRILKAGSDNVGHFGGTWEGGWHIQQVPEELADCLHYLQSAGKQFKNYLEVGAAAGGTARMFQEILGIENVFVIDNNSHPKCGLRKHILPHAKEWIVNSHSVDAFRRLLEAGQTFDLVLIDAEHHYSAVWQDFWILSHFLQTGVAEMGLRGWAK